MISSRDSSACSDRVRLVARLISTGSGVIMIIYGDEKTPRIDVTLVEFLQAEDSQAVYIRLHLCKFI